MKTDSRPRGLSALRLLVFPFLLATLAAPLAHALTATPSTTEGPYYPFNSDQTLATAWLTGEAADNDMTHIYSTSAVSKGSIFLLSGTLVDSNGAAISGATIELWNADNGGIYYYVASTNNYSARDSNFQPFGVCTTDSSGNWSFRTIKPGLYTGRIRHFHFKVKVNGVEKLTSQFMFSEDSSQFSADNVAAPLVSSGTMSLVTLTTTSGTDSSGTSVLMASKQIVLAGTYSTGSGSTTVIAPAITTQPSSASVTLGDSVSFTVAASGTSPTYQWYKGTTAISGATSATYTISSATASSAGAYSVVVSNSAGSATSSSITLTVNATADSSAALVNLSIRANLASSSSNLIAGFVVQSAGGKKILVRAVGPTLSQFGVSGAMTDPRLEIYDASSAKIAENDNWDSSLASTFTSLGAFSLPAGSKDSALTVTLPSGAGTAVVRGTSGGIALVEVYDQNSTSGSRIVNLSARTNVTSGDGVLIAGFVLNGTGSKRLLIRGIGPRLKDYGLSGALSDPKLTIYNSSGTKIAENDSWSSELATTFVNLGAFPLVTGSKDAALIVTLSGGGSYTAAVSSADGTSGEALMEFYEVP